MQSIIFVYDGHCVMCSAMARYVSARDRDHCVRLIASQSPDGRALCGLIGMNPEDPTSNLVVEANGTILTESSSSIRILEAIGWPRWAIATMRCLPKAIRDAGYRVIARNRFKLFGRRDVCTIVRHLSASER